MHIVQKTYTGCENQVKGETSFFNFIIVIKFNQIFIEETVLSALIKFSGSQLGSGYLSQPSPACPAQPILQQQ